VFEVELRALTPDEVIDLNFAHRRPEAPITDIKKEDGAFYNIRNHDDSGYLKSLEAWVAGNRKRLVASALISPELPGETLDEKVNALSSIEGWALVGLYQAVNMLLNVGADAVRLRQFRRDGTADS
jgi:hypothetical protein